MPKGSGIDNMVSKLPAVPYGDATLSQPHLLGLVLQLIQTGLTTWRKPDPVRPGNTDMHSSGPCSMTLAFDAV